MSSAESCEDNERPDGQSTGSPYITWTSYSINPCPPYQKRERGGAGAYEPEGA